MTRWLLRKILTNKKLLSVLRTFKRLCGGSAFCSVLQYLASQKNVFEQKVKQGFRLFSSDSLFFKLLYCKWERESKKLITVCYVFKNLSMVNISIGAGAEAAARIAVTPHHCCRTGQFLSGSGTDFLKRPD
jgi:hypothetical protein